MIRSKSNYLKFRVWDKITHHWLALCEWENLSTSQLEDERFIVQFFTFLVDKRGAPIYEGDLINFTIDGVTHGPDAEYEKNVEVWYSEEDAQFVFGHFKANDGGEYWYSKADRVSDIEVVGNIFENKYAKSN